MSSSKYILFTDHLACSAIPDRYIKINAKTFLDAFDSASHHITDEVYLVRIYERIPNTRGKKYIRIANLLWNGTLERITDDTPTDIDEMDVK
jgi:hypothetical protein